MINKIEAVIRRSISPSAVRADGRLTVPPSYGVFAIPPNSSNARRYRFGNYPVRLQELEREYGHCTLEHLFLSREDAIELASMLNRTQGQTKPHSKRTQLRAR